MGEKAQADSRSRLIESACDVFSQQGFDGASLRTIADRAGVSFQLIQHYFGNKQDLWLATLDFLYGCYIHTSKKLEFDSKRDVYTQFREHLYHMMAGTLERAQLRRIVVLEYFADSHRFHQIIMPRSKDFFANVISPYFAQVEQLGILKITTAAETAVLWSAMVTNNVVAPEIIEYFLQDPVGSPESIDEQIDTFVKLVTQQRREELHRSASELAVGDHTSTGDIAGEVAEPPPSNVIFPKTFGTDNNQERLLDAENRRLKQLVGELTLENRLLTDQLRKSKA